MPLRTLQIINLLGFILVIVLNTLANALPLNGYTTGQLSDRYPNLFVPAGFTFSIWGVIYILLLIFIIYQIRNWWSKHRLDMSFVNRIGPWFFVSCLANASWIIAWHYLLPELSLLIMLMILGSLIIIYLRLGIGQEDAPPSSFWAVRLPFSIYLGWITVATIANVTTVLVNLGWRGGSISEASWTIAMIGIATILGLIVLYRRGDLAYVAVLVWAFFGIHSKQAASNGESGVAQAAIIAMAALAIAAGIGVLRKRKAN